MKSIVFTLPGLAAGMMPQAELDRLKKVLPDDYNINPRIEPKLILETLGLKWLVRSLVNTTFETNEPARIGIEIGLELTKTILPILEIEMIDIDPELLGRMLNMIDLHLNGKFKDNPLGMPRFYDITRQLATQTNIFADDYEKPFHHARLALIEMFEAVGYYANDPADLQGRLAMTLVTTATEQAGRLRIFNDLHMTEAEKDSAWREERKRRRKIALDVLECVPESSIPEAEQEVELVIMENDQLGF